MLLVATVYEVLKIHEEQIFFGDENGSYINLKNGGEEGGREKEKERINTENFAKNKSRVFTDVTCG